MIADTGYPGESHTATEPPPHRPIELYALRGLCIIALVFCLGVPLMDLVRAGDRLSVLPNLQIDAATYDALAQQVAATRRLDVIPPFQPPGFVLSLAAVYALTGHSVIAAKIVLWLCLVLSTLLARTLARRLYSSEAAGWTAALLIASSPAMQAYTGTLQYEVMAAMLALALSEASIYTSDARDRTSVIARAFATGLLAGISVLTREVLIVLVPLLAVFVWRGVGRRLGRGIGVASGAVLPATALMIVLGWSAYLSIGVGRFVPVAEKGSVAFMEAHNPFANGTWNTPLSGTGQPAGLEFIRSSPSQELWLVGRRFLYLWGFLRDEWNVPRPSAVWLTRFAAGRVPMDLILPLARGGWLLLPFVLGLMRWKRAQWRAGWIVPASAVAILAVHLMTLASYRFAVPALPAIFVVASGELARWARRLISPRAMLAAALVLGVGLTMQMGRWPITYHIFASEMDGGHAENRVDADGRRVRFAAAANGEAPVLILDGEYLPSGSFSVHVRVRREGGAGGTRADAFRVTVISVKTGVICDSVVPVDWLPSTGAWTDVLVPCHLAEDSMITLTVESLGHADLAFSDVLFRWSATHPGLRQVG